MFRKYTNGSILRMHVDTVNTHVVSTIINVDQDVEEDWLLVILDHEDNEHSVAMRPGDMLLYESAKLLHGRPSK
jgi:prolyl 4-hydroxylase